MSGVFLGDFSYSSYLVSKSAENGLSDVKIFFMSVIITGKRVRYISHCSTFSRTGVTSFGPLPGVLCSYVSIGPNLENTVRFLKPKMTRTLPLDGPYMWCDCTSVCTGLCVSPRVRVCTVTCMFICVSLYTFQVYTF